MPVGLPTSQITNLFFINSARCGIVAIEAMGGPKIPFNIGREDAPNGQFCPAVGRLPDASQGAQHLRDVFYRMGFDDRSIVALSGAHTLGHCHESRSGYDGPWTHKPYKFDNSYFRLLLNLDWVPRKWDGPLQFEDATTGKLMMLPSDLCLLSDPSFKKYVELYATDQKAFFDDFSDAFSTLLAKGGRAKVQPGYVEDEEGEGSASDLDESLLRYYAATGSLSRLQLIAHRVDADAVDTTTGRSALHNAVFFGHGNVVKYLLRELHVNANVADHQGDTPLHDAARFGLNEIVSDLLAAGAIPNARNRQGKTAAEVALCSGKHMTVSLIPTASRL